MTENAPINQVASWVAAARAGVVLTGAGISTESGIPDFRSPGGVWSKYRTVYYDEFLASAEARHEYWRQKAEAHRQFADAAPNVGHKMLADWQRSGRLRGVVTQNIDGLHQIAGSQRVLELHGTAREVACLECGARYDSGPLVEEFLRTDEVPACGECGSRVVKHATVSFGQALPEEVFAEAVQWCREADLVLAIGSSLVVSPAADLPRIAKQHGARLVIINRDPTPCDPIADVVMHAGIGETLSRINCEPWPDRPN